MHTSHNCASCDCGLLFTLHTLPLWDGDADIAGRLFNGLTANDRWHRIYQLQQSSLSLDKGLMRHGSLLTFWRFTNRIIIIIIIMLAETVAQTDGQTFPMFIYRFCCSLSELHVCFNSVNGLIFCAHVLVIYLIWCNCEVYLILCLQDSFRSIPCVVTSGPYAKETCRLLSPVGR